MQHLFPQFAYGPALTAVILCSIIGLVAHRLVFKLPLFDVLISKPLVPPFIAVPTLMMVFFGGFLAAQVWQNWGQARTALSDEKLAASRIHNATIEPQATQAAVRRAVESYVSLVREKEWGENYNNQPSPEVERILDELRSLLRANKVSVDSTSTVATPVSPDLRRYLEAVELARERRLELGSRSRFGYLQKWVLLYLIMFVSAATVAAVHRASPRTAAIAMFLYCSAVALMFSMIALYIHPYKGPDAILPASLVLG